MWREELEAELIFIFHICIFAHVCISPSMLGLERLLVYTQKKTVIFLQDNFFTCLYTSCCKDALFFLVFIWHWSFAFDFYQILNDSWYL